MKKLGISKNESFILLGIISIAFILRFYILPFRQVIESDGVHWAMLGKNLFLGNGYTEPEGIFQWYYPPLYPINIGILWLLIKNIELAGGIVSLIYGSLLPLPIYFLTRRFYGKKTALISAILTALYPPLIDVSSAVLADSMFIFLSILVILVAHYTLKQNKIIPYLLLGGLLSLLYLTKSGGIQYAGVFLAWIILYELLEKRGKIRSLKAISLFLIGFAIFSLPYLVYLKSHFGRWTTSELVSISLFEGMKVDEKDYPQKSYRLTSDATEMEMWTSASFIPRHLSLLDIIKSDPQGFAKRYLCNLKKTVAFLFIGIAPFRILLLLLLGFGLFRTTLTKKRIKNELFLASMLLPMFTFPMITARTIRYMFPLMPIFIILYARGIAEFHDWLSSFWRKHTPLKKKRYLQGVFVGSLFIIIMATGIISEVGLYLVNVEKAREGYDPVEHKELGIWMNEHLGSGFTIMSASPHVAFYAKANQVTLPWAEFSEIIKYAQRKEVDYLVIGERYVPSERPLLAFLLDAKTCPDELKLIYKLDGKDKKIILYKLVSAK